MSKNTPGPWSVWVEIGGEREVVSVAGGERSYVARALDKHDAALIAQSPAMYSALEEILDLVDGKADIDEHGAPNLAMKIQGIAHAVLRKAGRK